MYYIHKGKIHPYEHSILRVYYTKSIIYPLGYKTTVIMKLLP